MSTAYYTLQGTMLGQVSSRGAGMGRRFTYNMDRAAMLGHLQGQRAVVDEYENRQPVEAFLRMVDSCAEHEAGGPIE